MEVTSKTGIVILPQSLTEETVSGSNTQSIHSTFEIEVFPKEDKADSVSQSLRLRTSQTIQKPYPPTSCSTISSLITAKECVGKKKRSTRIHSEMYSQFRGKHTQNPSFGLRHLTENQQSLTCIIPSAKNYEKRVEFDISLTGSYIDQYFRCQWILLRQRLPCGKTDLSCTSMMLCQEDQDLNSEPEAIEALNLYLKAKALRLDHWANQFLLLIGRNLNCISKEPDFLNLDVDTLCEILTNDYLDGIRETCVFQAGFRWLCADLKRRRQCINTVLSCPRYGLMEPKDIVQCAFRCRHLVHINLSTPLYPRSILTGIISRYLADLDMTTTYTQFDINKRFCMGQNIRTENRNNSAKSVSVITAKCVIRPKEL